MDYTQTQMWQMLPWRGADSGGKGGLVIFS